MSIIRRRLALVMVFVLTGVAAPRAETIELSVVSGSRPLIPVSKGCTPEDFPDSPLRAIRRFDGEVVVYSGHFVARAERGPGLDRLRHDCAVAYAGHEDPDPAAFDARAWIAAMWTADGKRVAAVVHNEYQAHRFPGRCAAGTYLPCWYSFLTLARSDDGGLTFGRPSPGRPLIAPGITSEEEQGRPRGFFGSSNLVALDGKVYGITMTTGDRTQPQRGNCLYRSADPFDSASWEILGEDGFMAAASNPYQGITRAPCSPIANLHGDVTGLVRHRGTGLFIATYIMPGGPDKGKVVFTTSADLRVWDTPRVLAIVPTPLSEGCQTERYLYPVLIDPAAKTRSFEDIGDTAKLVLLHADISGCSTMLRRSVVSFDVSVHMR